MNRFLTLIRRDMADNRGALIITPLVIAAILLVVTLLTSFTGNARFGFDPGEFKDGTQAEISGEFDIENDVKIRRGADGKMTITTPEGSKTIDQAIDGKTKEAINAILPIGTGAASLLPVGIAGIAILFVLAGGLHDERKDRTILFWKSMPVSDLQTVGAKFVSIVGVGLGFALLVTIVLHIAISTIAVVTMGSYGITGVSLLTVLTNAAQLWLIILCGILVYVGWALPVYGWVTMVSAWAPKMPFVVAFAPLIVVPLAYMAIAYRNNEDDALLDVLWDPAARIIGVPIFHKDGSAFNLTPNDGPKIPVKEALEYLSQSLTQPGFWLGLVITAGFIYAASEIRRRRAL